ncbi:MAG TPA: phage tail protein [Bryobacteraceae bacterium]|nr:phage tail protein [Bryobacteraceae bacterium]
MAVLRIDPLGVYNFYLTLLDSQATVGTLITAAVNYFVAGFSECTGMEATFEVMQVKEGGLNTHVWQLPVRASHSNITLKHGAIYAYDDLWDWHYSWVTGQGTRKDGLIVLKDNSGQPAKMWKFKRGIPTKWVGPSLNAMQSNVAIEALEIAHEGLELQLGA